MTWALLRSAAAYSPHLRTLCEELAREVPGPQRVIAFATAANTHGFGWHYDAEDVFIMQTAGDKEYYFRRNTQVNVASMPLRGQPDFTLYRNELSPLMSFRLIAGDWLYLPRGFWHVAYAHSDALLCRSGSFPSFADDITPQASSTSVLDARGAASVILLRPRLPRRRPYRLYPVGR